MTESSKSHVFQNETSGNLFVNFIITVRHTLLCLYNTQAKYKRKRNLFRIRGRKEVQFTQHQ